MNINTDSENQVLEPATLDHTADGVITAVNSSVHPNLKSEGNILVVIKNFSVWKRMY